MDGLKLLVVAALIAIVVSLGAALYHLATGQGAGSKKLVRALTIRVGLSIALFIVLMLAWRAGYISPHGVAP